MVVSSRFRVLTSKHIGPARVFDGEDAAFEAVQNGAINEGDVIIIRNEGPRGGPGMREMLAVTAALAGRQMISKGSPSLPTVASLVPAMDLSLDMYVRRQRWAERLVW